MTRSMHNTSIHTTMMTVLTCFAIAVSAISGTGFLALEQASGTQGGVAEAE